MVWLGGSDKVEGEAEDDDEDLPNDMNACRSALQGYSDAMGQLQACVVVSILPSDICRSAILRSRGFFIGF